MPELGYEPHPGGVGVLLMESMQKYRNNIAQIDTTTGKSQTYGEILTKSVILARNLQNKGITPDDVVALSAHNTLDSCLPLTACLLLGVPIAVLDPSFALNDVKHLLNISKPRLIFCESGSIKTMKEAIEENALQSEIVDLDSTGQCTPFTCLLSSTGNEDSFTARRVSNLRDTAVILFSSGTTGLAKGICLHHYGIMKQQNNFKQCRNTNMCLSLATLYWISAMNLYFICYCNGQTRVLCRKFDENTFMSIIQDYKVTFCFIAPVQTYALTSNPANLNYDTSALETIIVGGGFFGRNQHMKLEKFFPHSQILPSYGMTETLGLITTFHATDDIRFINKRYESCGRPVPGISYKIADLDTEGCLGPNQLGEIRLKSKMFTTGYYKNAEATASAWDAEGFLKTGDVGYYDDEQCFFVVDRIKDMFKYRSWHIQPAELEAILLTHPAVKEAAVIGVPHEVDGDHPVGFIVLQPGQPASAREILDFFNDKVSDHKKLRGGLQFVVSIPKTPSGKIRKATLRGQLSKAQT